MEMYPRYYHYVSSFTVNSYTYSCISVRMDAQELKFAKLTLRLRRDVIERGKAQAQREGTSLSKLVEQFLDARAAPLHQPVDLVAISDEIRAMMAPPRQHQLPEHDQLFADYADAVGSKHLRN